MPRGVGEIHVSAALTNIAVKYGDPAFVAEKIFPVVKVKKRADYYWVFGREALRTVDTHRGIGAVANEVEWSATPELYGCLGHGLREFVPDEIKANADPAIQPMINSTEDLVARIRRAYETRIQAIVQSTTFITNFTNVVTAWSAASGADPLNDVNTAKTAIRRNAGVIPNTIVMSEPVSFSLLEWMKDQAYTPYESYWKEGNLPPKLWGLTPIIAGAVQDTAAEGQTAVIADIWNDNVLVCYINPGPPGLRTISLGWTIRSEGFKTVRYRVEERHGEYVEVGMAQDEKLVATECGYLLVGANTGTGS